MADKTQNKGWRAAFGFVCLAVIVGSCVALLEPGERTPAEERAYQMQSAQIRCENETKSRLAESSGFAVDSYGQWRVMPHEEGEGFTFVFGFRAKNAFGVLIPASATCDVVYDGEYWSVTDLTIE